MLMEMEKGFCIFVFMFFFCLCAWDFKRDYCNDRSDFRLIKSILMGASLFVIFDSSSLEDSFDNLFTSGLECNDFGLFVTVV